VLEESLEQGESGLEWKGYHRDGRRIWDRDPADGRGTKGGDGTWGDSVCEEETNNQGFGATARSTLDTRKLDPSGIVVFHQADVGEFLRDEDTMF
jgi:hypothetical protein